MGQNKRRYLRNAAVALVLLVVAAWVLPAFFNAGRYRPLLKAGLERALHRKVAFGDVSVHFFPRLGFTVNNVVVAEDPAFGLEPFIRVDRLDCDLRWRSLWSGHPSFGTLRLSGPSINIVRNTAGMWNVENLLLQNGTPGQSAQYGPSRPPSNLSIEIEDARLNFKVGEDKKPFAIVNARAHLDFEYKSRRVDFRIAGEPVRTDLEFPTPGRVELEGNWSPERPLGKSLNATLRMQGTLLYDWVPLLTGHNPEVYGVVDSTIHLAGSLRNVDFSGESRLSQLHRWEQLPASNDMPCDVRFSGRFDRNKGNLTISGADVAFAGSQVHLAGSIENVISRPNFDLGVVFEQARLQDLLRLGKRVLGSEVAWELTGRLNGMVSMQGPWSGRQYLGFLDARDVHLVTPSGAFPVSEVAIQLTRSGARLSPARILLAPGVEVVAEGSLEHISPAVHGRPAKFRPTYVLTLSSPAISLERLLHFARAVGLLGDRSLQAEGIGSFTVHFVGGAWPWTRPSVTAQASIRSSRLVVPGLNAPLNVPRARVQVYGKQVIVNPVLAVMGTSVFSGWAMHQRGSKAPWDFSLRADKLSIEQASQWFSGTGDQKSSSFFSRISGIISSITGRRPSFGFASHLDARGRFSTPLLTYRALELHQFHSSVTIHNQKISIAKVSFTAGGGRGDGNAVVDLSKTPLQIAFAAGVRGASIQTLDPYLPAPLSSVRGYFSAAGSFTLRGTDSEELLRTLRGKATVQLESVNLGGFNPVRTLARRLGLDLLEAGPRPLIVPAATAHLVFQDQHATLESFPVEISGARFGLRGTYNFNGTTSLLVRADLRGVRQAWAAVQSSAAGPASRMADLRFAGTLRNLEMVPSAQVSQTQP
jgi:hypothetical protein